MQGNVLLSDSAAASLAAMVGMMRGPGDPAAQLEACNTVSVAFLTDLYSVRSDAAGSQAVHALCGSYSTDICTSIYPLHLS